MSNKRKSAAGAASRSKHLLCDRDCNHCPLVTHPNTRLLSALLNQLHDRFGHEVYRMVETACPNLTCCADCHIDDFCHVDGCEIVEHNKGESVADLDAVVKATPKPRPIPKPAVPRNKCSMSSGCSLRSRNKCHPDYCLDAYQYVQSQNTKAEGAK